MDQVNIMDKMSWRVKSKAKCSKCGKIWNIHGNPVKTDMMGYLVISNCNKMYRTDKCK